MLSQVDIYNLALGELGLSQEIEDLSESSNPNRQCNRQWENCRDTVLEEFPWNFSLSAVQLAEISTETFPGYDFVYQYPSDALFIRAVTDDQGGRIGITLSTWTLDVEAQFNLRNPFRVASKTDGNSRVLLTDMSDAFAIYTKRLETTGAFSSQFIEALACRLAWKIGPALQVDKAFISAAKQNYYEALRKAGASSLNEETPDRESESPSILIRS